MTWDAFHRRGEVLRDVLDHAHRHRDGVLPMELPGVAQTFGDELTLLGALQLRWHTHLSGAIERELMDQPTDLETAVLDAWRSTADDLPGVQMILDRAAATPASDEIAEALDTARRKDWTLMASMAGKASPSDRAAARVGRALEHRARLAHRPASTPASTTASTPGSTRGRRRAGAPDRPSVLERVKAHLAA